MLDEVMRLIEARGRRAALSVEEWTGRQPYRSLASYEAADADLTFETSWADWIAVTTHRGDPRKAMLTGRIRPRGSIRHLLRMPKIFPR